MDCYFCNFMFVYLVNEHVVANFASFSIGNHRWKLNRCLELQIFVIGQYHLLGTDWWMNLNR